METMNSSRRTHTAEIPTLLFPEALTLKPNAPALPAPCSINAIANRGSKMNCITGLWDLVIPSELLHDILSRVGLKSNIHASVVCKTWLEAAVAVRKFQPRPWLFYPQKESEDRGDYILYDPSRSKTYKLNFPELKNKLHRFTYSRDGWLLVRKYVTKEPFLRNPFTREHIHLPELAENFPGYCLAFSAAPTSSSCLVVALNYIGSGLINTWRPRENVWTTHRLKNYPKKPVGLWTNCVFSNGLFYFLSSWGYLGVFDPSKATWNNLRVKPYTDGDFDRQLFMAEHEGDIFLGFTRKNNNPSVFNFKLNFDRNAWEETRELGGLTVFASRDISLTRAGLPSDMRNRIYTPHIEIYGRRDMYYSLPDGKSSGPRSTHYLPCRSVWVDQPLNVNL